jgi:hypothetical protein
VHPSKIYNVMKVAAPVLYIGPNPSHVTEMLDAAKDEHNFARVQHGDAKHVLDEILRMRQQLGVRQREVPPRSDWPHSKHESLTKLTSILESV